MQKTLRKYHTNFSALLYFADVIIYLVFFVLLLPNGNANSTIFNDTRTPYVSIIYILIYINELFMQLLSLCVRFALQLVARIDDGFSFLYIFIFSLSFSLFIGGCFLTEYFSTVNRIGKWSAT